MKTELTVQSGGKDYPVEVDDRGQFMVWISDQWLKAPSLDELAKKARKIKVKFELPFTQVVGNVVRHGTVTGVHATNRNLLVKWDDGSTEQMTRWAGQGEIYARLNDEQTDELRRLLSARQEAQHNLALFTNPLRIHSLAKAAETAQAKAAEGEGS